MKEDRKSLYKLFCAYNYATNEEEKREILEELMKRLETSDVKEVNKTLKKKKKDEHGKL